MASVTNSVCNPNEEEIELRRGPWTIEEDTLLIHYIASHGEGHWNYLAKCSGLKRTGKSCRLRWLNYLKPNVKRGNLTPQEQLLILELHSKWGNRWSKIAQHLPGRTDNEIKNYWRTRVQKQARQLNIESSSKQFLDAVRCFWAPTLLQKMEQTSSPHSRPYLATTLTTSQNSASPYVSPNYTVPNPSTSFSTSPPIKEVTQIFDYPTINGNFSSVTSPCNILSSDSFISQLSQTSENPSTSSHAFDRTVYRGSSPTLLHDGYYADSSCYGMEGLNLDQPITATGAFDNAQFGCQMAASDWMIDNVTDTLWNMEGM